MAGMSPPDDPEKLEHYYKMFEKNNSFYCFEKKDKEACHELGDFYYKMNRIKEAKACFKLNCIENEFGQSCHDFTLLEIRDGFPDPATGFMTALTGCKGKEPYLPCCVSLATMLTASSKHPQFGAIPGWKQDKPEAMRLFRETCDGKIKEGCVKLMEYHIRHTKQLKEVLEFAEKACELKSRRGCQVAALTHETGSDMFDIKVDLEKAKYYQLKAMNAGRVRFEDTMFEKPSDS